MTCANPECDRCIDRSSHNLNATQTRYCSLYCYQYVKKGLKKIRASDSPHHKNIWKFPAIPTTCDNCAKDIELGYENKNANKSFCCRPCAAKARQLKGRRGFLRFQILRMLRDSDREWWSAADIADVMDQKQMIHRVNGRSISNHLRVWSAKKLVETRGNKNCREYRFNPSYKHYPLVALMRGDFN